MKKNEALIVLLGLMSAAARADQSPLIIGGHPVPGRDPISQTVAALVTESPQGQTLCTTSIIAPDLAITAAHCVAEEGRTRVKNQRMRLVFADRLSRHSASDEREVDHFEVAQGWNPSKHTERDTADLAVLHFSGGLPQGYGAATLLPFETALSRGELVELAGYGISNARKETGAGVLRKTEVTIANPAYSKTEVELDQSHGMGACHGDSGGPAYILVERHPFLFGVTSRGTGECDSEVIYTRIAAYADWLKLAVTRLHR